LIGDPRLLKVFRQRTVITKSLRTAGLRMAPYKKSTNNNVLYCYWLLWLKNIRFTIEPFYTGKHFSQYARTNKRRYENGMIENCWESNLGWSTKNIPVIPAQDLRKAGFTCRFGYIIRLVGNNQPGNVLPICCYLRIHTDHNVMTCIVWPRWWSQPNWLERQSPQQK